MQRRAILWGIALVGALASQGAAAEQESVSLPPSGDYCVIAVIAPGGAGGDVLGKDEHGLDDKFSVGIDNGGSLTVNGEDGGTVDPSGTYEICVSVSVGPSWTSYVTSVRDSAGNLVYQTTHFTADAPATSTASADEVVSLVVQ